jgi:hypothetical protein
LPGPKFDEEDGFPLFWTSIQEVVTQLLSPSRDTHTDVYDLPEMTAVRNTRTNICNLPGETAVMIAEEGR